MSTKKRNLIIAGLSVLVAGFTVWNVADFCRDDARSTLDYLALIFNCYAIIEMAKLIYRGVKYRG